LKLARTAVTFLSTGNPTGLKFAVEVAENRAIFDFGLEHAPGRALFSLGLEPRPGRELADLLAVGAAPGLQGVYDAWDGRTGVFISHLHLDHTSLVRYLHPDVPLFYPAEMEELRVAADRSGLLPWRTPAGQAVPDGSEVSLGEIKVRFISVDHDLPGATGFLVRTPDLSLAYTGDHRWHGLRPQRTLAFAEAVKGVDVLVQEGVSLRPPIVAEPDAEPFPAPLTEAEVIAGFEPILAAHSGLAVVSAYPMNRERLAGLAAACRRQGRRLLMEPVWAAVAASPDVFESPEPVLADPRGHCLLMDYDSLPRLIDLRPPQGSVYIQSGGAPMGIYDPAWAVMEGWLSRFQLELVRHGSSGHSWPQHIDHMVRTVRPRVVLPVHSMAPETLQLPGIPSLIPETWRPYTPAELLARASAPA
jgi:ribonuclease J